MYCYYYNHLDDIAIATHFSVAWSVHPSSVRLPPITTLCFYRSMDLHVTWHLVYIWRFDEVRAAPSHFLLFLEWKFHVFNRSGEAHVDPKAFRVESA